jgi:hypothetical protein
MNHRYCLDTSAISNPLMGMPEDCFGSLWQKIETLISSNVFCCNAEIAEQYTHIVGSVGKCLVYHTPKMLYEIGIGGWAWSEYILYVNIMSKKYHAFISDYHNNRQNTIDLKDLSLVALAKTLALPVVSMEGFDGGQISATKMRIPRLCINENVIHYTFIGLLRKEGITL